MPNFMCRSEPLTRLRFVRVQPYLRLPVFQRNLSRISEFLRIDRSVQLNAERGCCLLHVHWKSQVGRL